MSSFSLNIVEESEKENDGLSPGRGSDPSSMFGGNGFLQFLCDPADKQTKINQQ